MIPGAVVRGGSTGSVTAVTAVTAVTDGMKGISSTGFIHPQMGDLSDFMVISW